MSNILPHRTYCDGRLPFFNICMERVKVNSNVWRSDLADQPSGVLQGVEKIGLEAVEGFQAQRDAQLLPLAGYESETFDSPFPLFFRSAIAGHYTETCI